MITPFWTGPYREPWCGVDNLIFSSVNAYVFSCIFISIIHLLGLHSMISMLYVSVYNFDFQDGGQFFLSQKTNAHDLFFLNRFYFVDKISFFFLSHQKCHFLVVFFVKTHDKMNIHTSFLTTHSLSFKYLFFARFEDLKNW